MKRILIALSLSAALAVGGCTTLAQGITQTAQSLSSSTPQQATSLASAVLIADACVVATDTAVKTGKFDRATLNEFQMLRGAVRVAMDDLVRANTAKQSLTYAAFNAAFDAFKAYATTKGVSV